jgi:hypothetical protein
MSIAVQPKTSSEKPNPSAAAEKVAAAPEVLIQAAAAQNAGINAMNGVISAAGARAAVILNASQRTISPFSITSATHGPSPSPVTVMTESASKESAASPSPDPDEMKMHALIFQKLKRHDEDDGITSDDDIPNQRADTPPRRNVDRKCQAQAQDLLEFRLNYEFGNYRIPIDDMAKLLPLFGNNEKYYHRMQCIKKTLDKALALYPERMLGFEVNGDQVKVVARDSGKVDLLLVDFSEENLQVEG